MLGTLALIGALIALDGQPAGATLLEVSNVSALVSAPPTATGPFTATGTVKNTGTLAQVAGSKVTISATGATVGGLPAGCALVSAAAVCTAGALAPGQGQSFGVTLTPTGVTSVVTRVRTTAGQPDLNAPGDPRDDDLTATTQIVYSLDAGLSSQPSEVLQGRDTLLSATVTNNGIAQSGVTLTIATGGTVDPGLALPAGCAADSGNANVTCSNITLGTTETKQFDVAVTTPISGSTMHSTATAAGANGSGDVASTDTALSATAAALVLQGEGLPLENSSFDTVFQVPMGSARGLFLALREATAESFPPGTMCGTSACAPGAVEALFPNSGPWSANDPLHPLVWNITYKVKQACNGKGTPSGCLPLFVIPSGSTTAVQMPVCPSYNTSKATPPRMVDVDTTCLNFVSKSGLQGFVTYQVAVLRDVVIPIVSSIKG